MLNLPRQKGITLIEIVIGLAIISMTLGMGVAGLGEWTTNTKIRAAAGSIKDGLNLARAEAIKRNTNIRFQLVQLRSGSDCLLSTTGETWIVSLNDVSGKCQQAAAEPPPFPAAQDNNNPYIVQLRPATEIMARAQIDAGQSVLVFDGLGRRVAVNGVLESVAIDVTNPGGGLCVAEGGPVRCLRIEVSTMGQARMCDPALSSSDPKGC